MQPLLVVLDVASGVMCWAGQHRVALILVAVVLVGVATVRSRQRAIVAPRDEKRLFTRPERMAMFARAGGRCEHKAPLHPRCTEEPTHGDHVYPWSRGGATTMDNAQALCARHNGIKSNWAPTWTYIRRLERRRRRYFAPGTEVRIWWHQDSPPPWSR